MTTVFHIHERHTLCVHHHCLTLMFRAGLKCIFFFFCQLYHWEDKASAARADTFQHSGANVHLDREQSLSHRAGEFGRLPICSKKEWASQDNYTTLNLDFKLDNKCAEIGRECGQCLSICLNPNYSETSRLVWENVVKETAEVLTGPFCVWLMQY